MPLNYAWLRTNNDPTSLARIRDALNNSDLRLGPLNDRRAILDDLTHDPLYLTLVGVLAIGTTTALLLALLGNLLASWLSARGRLTNFAVMRALGTSPRQVAGVLTWEQGIIYALAIGLGIVSGLLFSLFVVPSLVFTSAPGVIASTGSAYISQSIPPIQLVFSPLLILGLAALVTICVIALWLMVRVVSRPSIGQTLRINED
ncbi:MAG: ABC transporter permease [Chloroflexota bacterium]|nr:ABC transporter permease [Chloroflexota bacterium]